MWLIVFAIIIVFILAFFRGAGKFNKEYDRVMDEFMKGNEGG